MHAFPLVWKSFIFHKWFVCCLYLIHIVICTLNYKKDTILYFYVTEITGNPLFEVLLSIGYGDSVNCVCVKYYTYYTENDILLCTCVFFTTQKHKSFALPEPWHKKH